MALSVRTRFAPSPTGRLHLGNVRAAVFNWLYARHHGGAFLLRIEDTDVERNVPGGLEGILEDLRWIGLDWDEGPDVGGPHAPYRQSERGGLHAAAAARLLAEGSAYPCFCSSADLDAATVEGRDGREVRHYPGTCRGLDPAERARRLGRRMPHVVRFAVPDGVTDIDIEDEVFGDIAFSASDIDDFIIRRADGRATYNFAVVVDDVDMRISHVIRGVGHLSNTPKQALLFDALGAARPRFAHLPTVLGPEGRKLSKREGASSVAELRALGYPASAVLNYVSLLGWSHPEEREVLSAEELIASISLDRVGRSDAHMDPDKLLWVSARHVARETLPELTAHVAPFLDHGAVPVPDDRLPLVVDALRSRLSTYGEIREHLPILFPEETDELDAARRAAASAPGSADVLAAVAHALAEAAPWEDEALGRAVRDAGSRLGARGASLFHPVRQALIGTSRGPDLGKILAAIGRDEALRRIRASLDGNPV